MQAQNQTAVIKISCLATLSNDGNSYRTFSALLHHVETVSTAELVTDYMAVVTLKQYPGIKVRKQGWMIA